LDIKTSIIRLQIRIICVENSIKYLRIVGKIDMTIDKIERIVFSYGICITKDISSSSIPQGYWTAEK